MASSIEMNDQGSRVQGSVVGHFQGIHKDLGLISSNGRL